MTAAYYVAVGSERRGPLTIEELRATKVSPDALVWTKGMADWARLDSVPELAWLLPAVAFATAETPVPPPIGQPHLDFILCNPRLPRMARLICVYAIVLNPALWLINTFSWIAFSRADEDSQMHAVAFLVTLVWALLSLAFTILLLVGGFKLRALRKGGLTLIQISLGSSLGIGVIFVILAVLVAMGLESGPPPAPGLKDVVDVVIQVISMLAVGFEIASLIWLFKNRGRLPLT